ncbi:MAG TPA: efflux RND transporter periplasmic adaptor subunit [Terriglobales bacterium]|nr:efflux RND transporter periplasmic adaptor subunit [Terriglobales bacterium]
MPANASRQPRSLFRRCRSWAGLVMTGSALLFLLACGEKKAEAPAPPEVEVISVAQRDVPLYSEWVATLDGYVNAQIQPQVTGYLTKRNYSEGTLVRKGDVLFEIDPRPFQAALEQTKGHLAEAQAQLAKTKLDVERDTPLAEQSAIPQAQLDNDKAAYAAAQAMVDAGQAQVDQAQLNLGFTKVRSLVDGIAGLAKGQIGDLVGPTTLLTTVSQVEPIKAYFALSDQEYLRAASAISQVAAGKPTPKAESGKVLELILSDGSVYPYKGWFEMADRQVDQKTGTIRIAGAFDNPGGILRPGQFARVRMATSVAKGALLVPQRAVVEIQGTYQVAVVGADNKADIRPVKVGERTGQMWIITAGLKPGEQVIVEGVQKARTGTPVSPKPWNPPAGGQ